MEEDKVVNASSVLCPQGRRGIVTTKTFESGRVKYECNMGSNAIGQSVRWCYDDSIAISCRDRSDLGR